MYLNAFQKIIKELLDEYDSLLIRQLIVYGNDRLKTRIKNIDNYVRQMCLHGDYEKVEVGHEVALCKKGSEPDYDIIRSFDVMLSFVKDVISHRKSKNPTSIHFFVRTKTHDKEMIVLPIKNGDEKFVISYANNEFSDEKCEVVLFLLDDRTQMKIINSSCNYRLVLITKNGVEFFKKDEK